MKSRILWANHAGYILKYDDFWMAADPWYIGKVFNNGWSLPSKTQIDFSVFEKIKYIWYSHEHPDHFNLPTLKAIPNQLRQNITVLFHETKDKRVIHYCRENNFKTIELKNKWHKLSDGVSVYCEKNGVEDSWIITKTPDATIVNLNDCIISDRKLYKKILFLCDGKIDVLLSQFGFAERIGNPDQTHLRKEESLFWMNQLKLQCELLDPVYVIPFANYKYFSHRENFYMNDATATPQAVTEILSTLKKTKTVVLYTGEDWEIKTAHNNGPSIEKYKIDWQNKPIVTSDSISSSEEEIRSAAAKYKQKLSGMVAKYILFMHPFLPRFLMFDNIKFYLSDLDHTYVFRLTRNDVIKKGKASNWEVQLHSSSLLYVLKYPFGANTLLANARFIISKPSVMPKLYNIAHLGLMYAAREKLNTGYIIMFYQKILKTLFRRKSFD